MSANFITIHTLEKGIKDDIIGVIRELESVMFYNGLRDLYGNKITIEDAYYHWITTSITRLFNRQYIPNRPVPNLDLECTIATLLEEYDTLLKEKIIMPDNFPQYFTITQIDSSSVMLEGFHNDPNISN